VHCPLAVSDLPLSLVLIYLMIRLPIRIAVQARRIEALAGGPAGAERGGVTVPRQMRATRQARIAAVLARAAEAKWGAFRFEGTVGQTR
jgi:hypothetical protein